MNSKDINLFLELWEYLQQQESDNPVAPFIDKQDVFLELDLELGDEGVIDETLTEDLKALIKYTPKTASTSFFNQLFGGRQSKASLGELLSVLLNNSMYTYKVAGPQVAVEKEIVSKLCRLIGYPESSGGTFAAGGSMTNLMAMIMARDRKVPDAAAVGLRKRLTGYTSAESHYSIEKNAGLCGIGSSMIRKVATNEQGEMRPEHLELLIKEDLKQGYLPFFVNATAGTTVLGAFDQLEKLEQLCFAYKLWLHVDGAYCGGVVFSKAHKHLVEGLEATDSFSFNAHKMLGTPLSCSLIVSPHKEQLHHSFSNEADYLYQTADDDYNLGKISLQCGRRNDALKLWTLWRSVGLNGLNDLVDKQFYLADLAREYIRSNSDYQLYSFDNSISVCFNYKNIPANDLCSRLYSQSELMIGFGARNNTTFIRLVTINSSLDEQAIFNFFNQLENFVKLNYTENFAPSNRVDPIR